MLGTAANFGLGAVQKRANLVDLEIIPQNELSIAKVGFDIAESGPSKIRISYDIVEFFRKCFFEKLEKVRKKSEIRKKNPF